MLLYLFTTKQTTMSSMQCMCMATHTATHTATTDDVLVDLTRKQSKQVMHCLEGIEPQAARQAVFEEFMTRSHVSVPDAHVIVDLLTTKSIGPGTCSDALLRIVVHLQDGYAQNTLFKDLRFNPSDEGVLAAVGTAYALRAKAPHSRLSDSDTVQDQDQVQVQVHTLMHCLEGIRYGSALRGCPGHTELLTAMFKYALYYDDCDAVKALLTKMQGPSFDFNFNFNFNPYTASSAYDTDADTTVLGLLLADGRANPAQRCNVALGSALALEQVERVKLLLADPRVDAQDTRTLGMPPFLFAIQRCHEDMVAVFLQSGRIKPAADNNAALAVARELKLFDIVDLLLADERVKSVDTAAAAI